MTIAELKEKNITELSRIARSLEIPGHQRSSQAGSDLQDPSGTERKRRAHLRRGRAGNFARRLRLPALAGLQLSARPRRHLRVALADPQVRPQDRRLHQRQRAPAPRRREVLRAGQDRGHQLRVARRDAQQDPLRQPHAALSAGTRQDGDGARGHQRPRHGPV